MSYAQPMQTKHAVWVLSGVVSGLLAGCGSYADGGTPEETDAETGSEDGPNPTGVSAGWDDETGGDGSGGVAGCGDGPQCGGSTPFCVDGECLGCGDLDDPDGACTANDSTLPVCGEGGCVECGDRDDSLCVDGAPVCGDDGACRGCSAHHECETACDLESGWCFDEVVTLGEDTGAVAGELSALLGTVESGGRLAIRIVPGETCLLDTLVIDEARSIALIGEKGERPCLTSWDERAAITVAGGSALYLLDVRLEESYGVGVEVRGASAHAERSELVNNSGGAFAVSQESMLTVRNSLIGGDRNNVSVLRTHSSTVTLEYATVVAGFGTAQGVVCDGDNDVSIRNSIVISEASMGEIDCPAAKVSYTALEAVFGEGNVAVGAVDTAGWFEDYPRGDLHLRRDTVGMPFEGIAVWSEGDPWVDIDGDPRPAVPEIADWVGADIP